MPIAGVTDAAIANCVAGVTLPASIGAQTSAAAASTPGAAGIAVTPAAGAPLAGCKAVSPASMAAAPRLMGKGTDKGCSWSARGSMQDLKRYSNKAVPAKGIKKELDGEQTAVTAEGGTAAAGAESETVATAGGMARAVGTRTDGVRLSTEVAAAAAAAAGVPLPMATQPAAGGNSKTAAVARTAGMARDTAAAGRGRPAANTGREYSSPMQPASAADVIVIDNSDDESAELAAGVLGAGEGGPVFQQPREFNGKAGVKQDTEAGNASAVATAAAVEVCSVPAAVLGEGGPAAPTPEAVEAQAALAAAGEQMARNQQLRGILEPGLNAKEAVVEGRIDGATPKVPGEAAAAGASSGNAIRAAAAGCAIGLENSAPKVHVPATAAAATYGDGPMGVGLIEGEQASAKLQTDAAADCSAGSGEATAVLAGGGVQGMAGCAE